MADKTPLLPLAELQRLIEKLVPANEDMDELSASIILTREGVDLGTLPDDLKVRLERGLEEMRAKGEEVPPELVEMVALLEKDPEPETQADIELGAWIDSLLAGQVPGGAMGASQQRQAFRSMRKEGLTENDLLILERLAAEIQSQTGEKEG